MKKRAGTVRQFSGKRAMHDFQTQAFEPLR